MSTNTILGVIILFVGIILILIIYYKSKLEKNDEFEKSEYTFKKIMEHVKYEIIELIREEDIFMGDDEEFEAMYKRKARLQKALRDCMHGMEDAKEIVKDLIKNILTEKLSEDNILKVIDFKSNDLSETIKFEILLQKYKNEYGKDALKLLIEKYDLDRVRTEIEDNKKPSYLITNEDINEIYFKEKIKLDYNMMLEVLTTLIYQKYKGFGIVDTIREMNIDGFNIGTSGSIIEPDKAKVDLARSVWIFFKGRYIHLRFTTFETMEELKRVVTLLSRYNNIGALTEKKAYKITTSYDKSRIVVIRPPASECWAAFIRKFTLKNINLYNLINQEHVNNSELPISILRYLMMGEVTCGVTGSQGTGKTTLLSALIENIDARYTIRVLELAPELYLRELYPERNILTVIETPYTTTTELQDVLKKTDAAVSLAGEVADDNVAAKMIQMGQVSSIFTLFSHHATTAPRLIYALRNSLVNAGGFTSMVTAEQQVVEVVRMDIHLQKKDGKRYIERISEIIALEEGVPYPEYDNLKPVDSMNEITAEYYRRTTDRKTFYTKDIMVFNEDTENYEAGECLSAELIKHILNRLPINKKEGFKIFLKENWGTSCGS